MTRLCECGCKASLEGKRPEARYATAVCRTVAYRERHNIVGYKALKASPNARKRRGGLQLSYRKAVDQLARYLPTVAPLAPGGAVEEAERILRPALPPSAAVHLEREAA